MIESTADEASVELLVRILRSIVNDLPDGREISADDRLLDLGVTSLQLIQLVFEIERAFGIDFPDSAFSLETFESVKSLAAVVDLCRGSGSS